MDSLSDITVLIDDSLKKGGDSSLLFTNPTDLIIATKLEDVAPAVNAAAIASENGKWVAGFIAYEAAPAFDDALITSTGNGPTPLVWFAVFDIPQTLSPQQVDALWQGEPDSSATNLTLPLDRSQYKGRINAVQEYLSAGDAYQINFTMMADFEWVGTPKGLYHRLRQGQRTHHSAFISTNDWSILSISPELFLTRDGTNLTTKPMKGTAPRALNLADDHAAANLLQQDSKSRAENLMIVDLLRNDMSRVTRAGSVKVEDLFAVEHYPSLNTMTSTVVGTLDNSNDFSTIMAALFPCGSVTGAPKARAMQIINELENDPRGVYTGAIGLIKPGGDFSFNVAIRTPVLLPNGKGIVGLGSGIVADSQADAEYDECLLKGRFLTDPQPGFELFETTVWNKEEGFRDLAAHLSRMKNSADYFGFHLDDAAIQKSLTDAEQAFDQAATYRVRFAIDRYGTVSLRTVPLEQSAFPSNGEIALAETHTRSTDIFLHHKTSHRALYDQAMMDAADNGLTDYIFVNENGHVTEGARTNLFIVKDGNWLTPSLDCGVLPGTARAKILKDKQATETQLTINDLKTADALYVSNGVIGLVPVTLRD